MNEGRSAEDIASSVVHPRLFVACVEYVTQLHPRPDDDEAFVGSVFLMSDFLRSEYPDFERPWEVMFSIQTRMSALVRLVEKHPLRGMALRDVSESRIWAHHELLSLAATAPLRRTGPGFREFDPVDFVEPPKAFDWDAEKAALNLSKHDVAFESVFRFDWAGAIEAEDTRYDYGETRIQALGKIGDRYHVLVYALREDTIRVISLRKANSRERPR